MPIIIHTNFVVSLRSPTDFQYLRFNDIARPFNIPKRISVNTYDLY